MNDKTNLLLPFTAHKMGWIGQLSWWKSVKQVQNLMTQHCLTQVWNWNRLLVKDTFWDETELLFEWKWMKNVWKTLEKTYTFVLPGFMLQSLEYLVGKVLPKEEGREGGEKTRTVRPRGPGLEPETCRVLGKGPQLHARGLFRQASLSVPIDRVGTNETGPLPLCTFSVWVWACAVRFLAKVHRWGQNRA